MSTATTTPTVGDVNLDVLHNAYDQVPVGNVGSMTNYLLGLLAGAVPPQVWAAACDTAARMAARDAGAVR